MNTYIVDGDVPSLLGVGTMDKMGADIFIKYKSLKLNNDCIDEWEAKVVTFISNYISNCHIKLRLYTVIEMAQENAVHLTTNIYETWKLTSSKHKNFLVDPSFPTSKVREIHEQTCHKNLLYDFETAGLINPAVSKTIAAVVEKCQVCRENRKSITRPKAHYQKSLPVVETYIFNIFSKHGIMCLAHIYFSIYLVCSYIYIIQ